MNVAQNTGSVGLAAMGVLLNSGFIDFFNGTMPVNPQTALSGNTLLASGVYSSTAFGSPSYSSPNEQATGSFAGPASPVANGGATFARAYKTDHTTAWADLTVGSVWLASTAFAVGQYCTNGGNTYKCTTAGTSASSGGPSGTGGSIADGSVVWAYQGAGQLFDVLMGNCNVQLGTQITFTHTLKLPLGY